MLAPPPKRPAGGAALLMLLVLAFVVGALLVWGFLRLNPSRPTPAGTAHPKVLPAAASSAGGAPAR